MRRASIVAFAVIASLLVATAPPATAATGVTAIGSENDTDTELSNGSLSNVEVVGSGSSAVVAFSGPIIEDFEDGDKTVKSSEWSGWNGDTGALDVQSTTALEGSLSGRLNDNGGTPAVDIQRNSPYTPTEIKTDVYLTASPPGGDRYEFELASGGTVIFELWWKSNTAFRVNRDSGEGDWSTNTHYTIRVFNIDYANDQLDFEVIRVSDSTVIFSKTNEPFQNAVSDLDTIRIGNNANENGADDGDIIFDKVVDDGSNSGTYIGDPHDVDDATSAFVELPTVTDTSITVTWQGSNDGGSSWSNINQNTYTTTGTKTVSLPDTYELYRPVVDFSGQVASAEAELDRDAVEVTTDKPLINNSSASPSGGEFVNQDPITLSINVSDPDFADDDKNEQLSVEFFVNGSSAGTDTLNSNGTASIEPSNVPSGDVQWHAVVTDTFGNTNTSDTFFFETPSQLTVRNESNASEIVTGANVTITFYSADGETIIQKTDNDGDGNISLAGLPITEFVGVVDAEGWHSRRFYIESILNQQDIYLLNSTAFPNPIDTTFVYEDRTGSFESSVTTLRIQRGVDPDNDGNFSFQTVAGDFWGAAGEFPFTGEPNARYRLVIENTETNTQRVLGTHIPTADGTKNIVVGSLEWPALNGTGRVFDAQLEGQDITVLYHDPGNNTTDVRLRVWELGNKSNKIYDENFTNGPYGTLQVAVSLTADQAEESWVVNYTASHDEEGELTGQVPVGGNAVGLPVDPWLLGTIGWVFVTFVTCLYGPRTAVLGAWTLVILAGGLMLFQWVTIPTASLVTAVLIASGGTWYREAVP